MLSTRRRILVALALAFAAAPAALAQAPQAQSAPKADDNYVTSKMFQNRVFDVKNRDPQSLSRVLYPLTSGFKGAVVSPNEEFRTITVRDFPENIAAIEDALKRLDTPEAPHPEVELHIHVLIAGNTDIGASDVPAELKDVVGQLRSTLNFKNYYLLTSIIQRAKERPGYNPSIIQGDGVASIIQPGEPNPREFHYVFGANALTLGTNSAGVTTVQLAQAGSVVANGGMLVRPRLVLKKGGVTVPPVPAVRVIKPETAITMRQMMEGVVLHGTGTNARLQG